MTILKTHLWALCPGMDKIHFYGFELFRFVGFPPPTLPFIELHKDMQHLVCVCEVLLRHALHMFWELLQQFTHRFLKFREIQLFNSQCKYLCLLLGLFDFLNIKNCFEVLLFLGYRPPEIFMSSIF